MAKKKNLRSDNTYLVSQESTDNPKLGAKKMQDGRESLYLDYYYGYQVVYDEARNKKVIKKDRKREYLSLYLWQSPRTPEERQQNKDVLELARRIRYEKEQELLKDSVGYRLRQQGDINFLDYYQNYVDNYTKRDFRDMRVSLSRFRDFLRDTPRYNQYVKAIRPRAIDKDMIVAFTEYLKGRSRGDGANTIYARFKKVIKYALEHDVFLKNPCEGVSIKVDRQILRKEILSEDEIKKLIDTHYHCENPNVRNAFIFCLYTGLRWCDVRGLTYSNVDVSNRLLSFEQNKTKGHSSNSGVVIPLNDGLLKLIGEPQQPGNRDELVFPLPTYESCLKALGRWVKRAGINKHISWHCARHSFAVNILNNGANIKTVSSLLGHSTLTHTEKYTRAIDSLKRQAIDSLPVLNI